MRGRICGSTSGESYLCASARIGADPAAASLLPGRSFTLPSAYVLENFTIRGSLDRLPSGSDIGSESRLFCGTLPSHVLHLESELTGLQQAPKTVNQEPKELNDTFVMWNPILANSCVRDQTRESNPF